MSFLPYKIFIYLNLLVGVLLVISPWVLSKSSGNIAVAILGLIVILAVLFSEANGLTQFKYLNKRVSLLILFVSSILLNFTPYIFSFTKETNLVWIVFGGSTALLLSLIFTKFEIEEEV